MGEWTLIFTNPATAEPHEYALAAIGYSTVIDLSARADRSQYTWPQPMRITATAVYRSPISGAQMEAVVHRPQGPPVAVALQDNGRNGDEVAGDGVYSGLFERWNGDGGYTVDVRAAHVGTVVPVNGAAISPSPQIAPTDVAFRRVQPFGVTMSGAPRILHSFLCVDKASFRVDAEDEERSKLSIAGCFDAEASDLDWRTDDLLLSVGGLDYAVPGSALTRVGTKERFTYTDAARRFRIDVELYLKGSSRARFRLRDTGFAAAQLGDLAAIEVGLRWGSVDIAQTILPEVRVPGADARFAAGKQRVSGDQLALTKLDLRDEASPLADRLALSARIEGELAPDQAPLSLRIGTFERVLPPSAWRRSGERYTLRYSDGSLLLLGTYDRAKRSFSVRGSGFDFAGLEPSAAVGFSLGSSFNEFLELRLAGTAGRLGY
jgi:hypothetical protein